MRAIPYKGAVLAAQAYGDVTLRQFEDLDIILPHADLAKAHEAMLGLGYRPKFPWILSADVASSLVPGDYIYRCTMRDRRWSSCTRSEACGIFRCAPDLEDLGSELVPVSLSGHEIETFCAEDALAILCVHGSKHFWEKTLLDCGYFGNDPIASGSGLERGFPPGGFFSTRGRMLSVGLALAADLLGAPLPADVSARV